MATSKDRKSIRMEDIYELEENINDPSWYASAEEYGYTATQMHKIMRGEELPSSEDPFRAKLVDRETETRDFLQASDVIIVSDRVINLFLREKVSGWKTFPARLQSSSVLFTGAVHGLAIVGRTGPEDEERGVRRWREYNGVRIPVSRKGLYFDMTKWDGSDLFMAERGLRILAVPRVIRLLEANNITGWCARPVLDIEF